MTSVETSWLSVDSATCAKGETEKTVTLSFMTNRSRGIKVLLMVSLGMCKNRYSTSAVYNMEKGVVKLRIMSHALIWFK